MQLSSLQAGPRLPVLFIGHGSPMNVIQANPFRTQRELLGVECGRRWPRPQLILCISAHWLTRGWWLTGMAQPLAIHDFGGFPRGLYAHSTRRRARPPAQMLTAALRRPMTGPSSSTVASASRSPQAVRTNWPISSSWANWPGWPTSRTSIFCPCSTRSGRRTRASRCSSSTPASSWRRSPCVPCSGRSARPTAAPACGVIFPRRGIKVEWPPAAAVCKRV